MAPRTASPAPADPDAIEFVRFCYRRRRVGWPELYDEMCAVAARGLYRGMGADELAGIGIGLALFDMPGLAGLAATVVAEEQARRRPVAVAIVADPPEPVVPDEIVIVGEAGVEVLSATATAVAQARDARDTRDERPAEREMDLPARLAPAPAGA